MKGESCTSQMDLVSEARSRSGSEHFDNTNLRLSIYGKDRNSNAYNQYENSDSKNNHPSMPS